MELQIRAATSADLDFLVDTRMEVLRTVFSISPQQDVTALRAKTRAYYRQMQANGGHIACLVFHGADFAGCGGVCLYQEMPSPDNPSGLCGFLMNIYTRAPYRRRGVGELVVRWLVRKAREQGAGKIFLETSAMGRPFYERLGFVPMPDEMQLLEGVAPCGDLSSPGLKTE